MTQISLGTFFCLRTLIRRTPQLYVTDKRVNAMQFDVYVIIYFPGNDGTFFSALKLLKQKPGFDCQELIGANNKKYSYKFDYTTTAKHGDGKSIL